MGVSLLTQKLARLREVTRGNFVALGQFEHTREQSGTRMRVVVDLNRCLGYAQCAFLAPSVFRLNGEEALQYDPNPDDATRLKVLRAAAACPVQAILVEHLSGKEGEATS